MRTGFRRELWTSFTLCFVLFSVSLVAQKSGDDVGAVTAALRAGEFPQALQLLQPLLRHSPESAQLWTLQGLAYSGEGHKKEALASFHAALKVSADYLPALEGAAQIEYDAGSKEAAPLLHRVLRLRPNDTTSHAMLAVLAYKEGDCATAVQHFEQSGALINSQPAALQEYGICLVKQKQLDRAIGVFQKSVDLSSGDGRAICLLAAVQLMAEKPKDAVATLTPLLQANTPDESVLHLAASAYEASGDTPEAVRTLRQAIVTDPRNAELYIDFANLSMDHQSFQAGIDMINSGLAFQPESASLYVARGVLYVQLAEYDKAEADFEKADTLDPRHSIGAAALGLAALQKNDLDAALATVRSKLARKPSDPYLLYLQADILSQKGPEPGSPDFQAAIRSASRAVSFQPSLVPAHDLLAKLYLQAGQNAQAAQQARKALENDPKDQTALYHLIQGLRKTGDEAELPPLVKRLAELRQEATREEREHNRYKLVVGDGSAPK